MAKDYIPEPSYTVSFLFRRVLVPVDGSAHSTRAVKVAVDFAQRYGSRLTFLHVLPAGKTEKDAENVFSKIREIVREAGITADYKVRFVKVPEGSVSTIIIKEASEGLYSAIIMGSRGLTEDEELPLGHNAASVSLFAPCSVLIIR